MVVTTCQFWKCLIIAMGNLTFNYFMSSDDFNFQMIKSVFKNIIMHQVLSIQPPINDIQPRVSYIWLSIGVDHLSWVNDIVGKYTRKLCRMSGLGVTLRPRQDGCHFPDDIFRCIFLNENIWIVINISLSFVPKGQIDNILALGQIMAWRRSGNKPLSKPMMVSLLTHICVTQPQWVNLSGANWLPTNCLHSGVEWSGIRTICIDISGCLHKGWS